MEFSMHSLQMEDTIKNDSFPFGTDPLEMFDDGQVLKKIIYQLPHSQIVIICDLVHEVLLNRCKLLVEFATS
jgi:hypothetical protein